MKKAFLAVILSAFVWQCKSDFESVSPTIYVSNNLRDKNGKTFYDCTIRFHLVNTYIKRDKESAQKVVSEAFGLWQRVNNNLAFVETSVAESAEIIIKFVEPSVVNKTEKETTGGLIPSKIKNLSSLKQESNKQYAIVLDNTHDWTDAQLLKAIAYHIGFYLGLATSSNTDSIMYPIYGNTTNKITKEDSTQINTLYLLPCKDSKTESLPIKFRLSNQVVTKEFTTIKAGVISVKSSGIITVGPTIGNSGPNGQDSFLLLLFAVPIDKKYYIVPNYPHGSVMYKVNNEKDWQSCKSNCEFSVRNGEFISISFLVNDSVIEDNTGWYDVEINYK